MNRILLTKEHVYTFLRDSIYDIPLHENEKTRCCDGRYLEHEKRLSAFALPGGDVGQLFIIASSGRKYGFEVDLDTSYNVLCDIVSGEHNLGFHTDSLHHTSNNIWDGCDYIRAVTTDPGKYGLSKQDIDTCLSYFNHAVHKGFAPQILHGDHKEGALLLIYGDYGINPLSRLKIEGHEKEVQVFVQHMSLINNRHRRLAKELIRQRAVTFYANCDEEYLYEVFSETAETHLFESMRFEAKGIPVYEIHIDTKTEFDIKEMGTI